MAKRVYLILYKLRDEPGTGWQRMAWVSTDYDETRRYLLWFRDAYIAYGELNRNWKIVKTIKFK